MLSALVLLVVAVMHHFTADYWLPITFSSSTGILVAYSLTNYHLKTVFYYIYGHYLLPTMQIQSEF